MIGHADAVAFCRKFPVLTSWELRFLLTIAKRHRLSEKQQRLLDVLVLELPERARRVGMRLEVTTD